MQRVILGALFKAGTGLLNGLNEGVARSFFLVVFLLPLLTRGAWLMLREQRAT